MMLAPRLDVVYCQSVGTNQLEIQMRRSILSASLFVLAACGGSGDGNGITLPPPKKPDPFITVRFRNLADTTTAIGRAHWHIFMDITSADPNKTGFVAVGNIGLNDLRLNHPVRCQGVGADSVGQRFVAFVAVADTSTEQLTPDASAEAIARAWFAGDHNLPSGVMVLYQPPADAWTSAQFTAGHGLVQTDPIKWGFDWTGDITPTFYERTDTDTSCGVV